MMSKPKRPPSQVADRQANKNSVAFQQTISRPAIARIAPSVEDAQDALIPEDKNLLERSLAQWQVGEWDSLGQLDLNTLQHHPERAQLALLAAAGHQQLGHIDETRRCASQAMDWGCSKAQLSRILTAGVHNTLGRCAAALHDEPRMNKHFSEAVAYSSGSQPHLASQTRALREMSNLGLLAYAVKLVDRQLKALQPETWSPTQVQAQVKILQTQLSLLQHELSIAQLRGQLQTASCQVQTTAKNLGQAIEQWRATLQQRAVSQLGQELWVLEKTNYKQGGFFVEFGATNGVLLSNTYLLEKEFNWQGLCAEPNPRFFADLKKNRACTLSDACISAQTGEKVEFIFADEFGGMSRDADNDMHQAKREAYQIAGETAELVTISLHDFLILHNAPKTIDYLSIDTEGSEYSILEAFPFHEWNVLLLTVEHNFTKQRAKIRTLLELNGYVCQEAQWDDWYLKAL